MQQGLQGTQAPSTQLRRRQHAPARQRGCRSRAEYGQEGGGRGSFSARPAPPLESRPSPSPPPPPPEFKSVSKRDILLTAGISILAAAAYRIIVPMTLLGDVVVDRAEERYAVTAAHNTAVLHRDDEGRAWLYDEAGHLYYDTGSPSTGILMVDSNDDVYNSYQDAEGKVQRVLLGPLGDMRTVPLESVGGIPMPRDRQGRLPTGTFFLDRKGGLLPPNAPLYRNQFGKLEGPPMLEEGTAPFEPK